MRSLGWVTRDGNGLAWVGKRPKTEAELLAMATILSENVRSRDIASYRAYNKKDKKEQPEKEISDIAEKALRFYEERHAGVEAQRPKKERAPKRKKYSILWGLFTWEK